MDGVKRVLNCSAFSGSLAVHLARFLNALFMAVPHTFAVPRCLRLRILFPVGPDMLPEVLSKSDCCRNDNALFIRAKYLFAGVRGQAGNPCVGLGLLSGLVGFLRPARGRFAVTPGLFCGG